MRARRVLCLVMPALAACTPPPPVEAPPPPPVAAPPPQPAPAAAADDFRRQAPEPGPEVTFTPPRIQEAKLANGVRVLVVERRELPIVAVEITTDRGAEQAAPAIGAFAGDMLVQGTKTRSALELSDAMGKLGANFGSWVGFDGGGVSGQSLAPKLGEMLTILADAYMNPAFSKAEVDRERARRITALAQMNDRPSSLLSIALGKTIYPAGHPYSVPLLGTEEALKRVTPADLARFHAAHFQPDHTTIAFAGDITRDAAVKEAERVLGAWKGTAAPAKDPEAPPPAAAGAPIVVVDRAKLTQSTVAVGLPGVARSTPDYEAILVMNTILGGKFSSRLNMNLREKHAYTYGARSGFDMRHGPGPFTAGGAIVRDGTGPAVKEILSEIRRIRGELVSAEELEDAKLNLIRQLPARFETAGATASTLSGLAMYHLSLDELANRAAKIRRVTREDVRRVAEAYLVPEKMRVVMVADAGAVRDQLTALGLGDVEVQQAPGAAKGAATQPAKSAPAKAK
ncbi:MAG: insulinase family protein [Polyangiaceae bacterium]|nr:insulinase family protein [Polyangiaceae bacterium]